jgi:hypothetical protein
MPLYTYIASYQEGTHVDQDRKSNFKGSAALVLGRMPDNALPGLTSKALRKEMVRLAYVCEWMAVPNRLNLWHARFELGDSTFELYAVQTQT